MAFSHRDRALKRTFEEIIDGKPITKYNFAQFLESIHSRPDPASCVDKIIASRNGLVALQQAMRLKLDPQFFNEQATPLLKFLQAPDLKIINGGLYLNQIVRAISEPPIFWDAFRREFLNGGLNEQAKVCLGWLLLQLCGLPTELSVPYRQDSDTRTILDVLLSPSSPQAVRSMGYNIKHVLDTCVSLTSANAALGQGPGGRHDNDFEDFRTISILPTADEIASTEPAFLRPTHVLEDPATKDSRISIHLDNQFRLLRDDMLYEMREELQIVFGAKKGIHRGTKITDLYVKGFDCGAVGKRTKWSLVVVCQNDIPRLSKEKNKKSRKEFLDDHPRFLKHQSLACLVSGNEVIAFPTILRDEDRLAKVPPEVVLQFDGHQRTVNALRKLKTTDNVTLIQIDTAIFAYEPILKRLQSSSTLPLASELLLWTKGEPVGKVSLQTEPVVQHLQANPSRDLKHVLSTSKDIKLDASQASSFISGLTQQVSLIHGPPGTGKSFIGALIAKALYDYTDKTILVVCFTNHALDDILEGLISIGIPMEKMLRLGGKSTTVTGPLTVQNQQRVGNRTRDQWTIIDNLKSRSEDIIQHLQQAYDKYDSSRISYGEIADYLEFRDPKFFEALKIPSSEDPDGMKRVDHRGREVRPFYLMSRWQRNLDAGAFVDDITDPEYQDVWRLPKATREALWKSWEEGILQGDVERFCELACEYNRIQEELATALNRAMLPLLRTKRVLGCTTTAAAKYCEDIQAFNPGVLLVEEAAEILESHILTAMGPETSQLILIGDHKQLRPKVNNYLLTVERGEGYDLNRSLFERLIRKNYPHESLSQQHRMRPEISALIKELTYPELVDADSTQNRPDIIGLQDNILFIHHQNLEGDDASITDPRDMAAPSSKFNMFEVEMILKIVKYLGQQGYGTDDLVILTPYLGQLQKLRHAFKKDSDPVLNDLDSYDLVRAGLVNKAEAQLTKKSIRLATIDNYQGEECNIVIVSLTRSNSKCEIGFMFSPERLNVLLSRSRNGLILIGNMNTFRGARKGKDLWTSLLTMLSQGKHIYEGLPIRCERHPNKTSILCQPEEFDIACPDGGCDAPCGALLSCGVHACHLKCHQLSDHSKMKCEEVIQSRCPIGHPLSFQCGDGAPGTCKSCERETKLARQKQVQDLVETQRRDEEQRAHLQRMDELEASMAAALRRREESRLTKERAQAIQQKQSDLAAILALDSGPCPAPVATPLTGSKHGPAYTPIQSDNLPIPDFSTRSAPNTSSSNTPEPKSTSVPKPPYKPFPTLSASPSKLEWTARKSLQGITNQGVDAIMDMTGLERVKAQILEILAKIETTTRQNASLKQERFNAVLLGNPGTGKTTVARHYAQVLSSLKVTPGSTFSETTGSKLAHEGVDGAKNLLDSVIKSGGGTIFIDEAYQLASGHSSQGHAVLDFLLAEMENNIGVVVFLLAGYNKEMEKFFEHNPGLQSRVPVKLQFADYKDEELMNIFEGLLSKTYQDRMKVEGGTQGLYSRIAIRRLGRRRDQPGFGNARDLQVLFARIRGRQAKRVAATRQRGEIVDDFLLTGEDVIGPEPSNAILESQAWQDLEKLIGLKSVKETVKALVSMISENYQRELMEKEPIAISLNRVFLGSPGTGKTTVAKLYGQVLADLCLLTNGEVVVKNPSDFIGAHVGQSEAQTKGILATSVGKVLIIDEAYMLYGGGGGASGSNTNQFKTSVIDTLVAEVQNVPGDDRCVLLLGYRDQMLEMFQNVNPGLSRRFKLEEAFNFEDFDDSELLQILEKKLFEKDLDATDGAKRVAIDRLSRMRNRPNFGNAGEVENIITEATRCLGRRALIPASQRPPDIIFEAQDIDPDYNRAAMATVNIERLFEDIVGTESIVQRLKNYLKIAQTCRERELDLRQRIPTNFVFTGPPGTGKTTVARKMGQVFYDMGMLASAEVIECSASDLVGQYVGQTGPKTKTLFEKALGKVLFIDEAYRLSQGHFAQEAIDELVGLLTHPNFKSKLIVILAGYEDDMNHLMSVNTGLSSRFPEQIFFHNMSADDCLKVVRKELEKEKVGLLALSDESSGFYMAMRELVRDLSELKDWGNARDMMTLSKELIGAALQKPTDSAQALELTEAEAEVVLKKMVADRQRRSKVTAKRPRRQAADLPVQTSMPKPPTPPPVYISTETSQKLPPASPPPETRPTTPNSVSSVRSRGRGVSRGHGKNNVSSARQTPTIDEAESFKDATQPDPGVSDSVWQDLLTAKRTEAANERRTQNSILLSEQVEARNQTMEQDHNRAAEDLAKAEAKEADASKRLELQRSREQERLKAHDARVARVKAARELDTKKEAERKRKEQEVKAQCKLREMGVCPVGFRWINMGSYYRCAGGSHVVSLEQLGL